MQIGAEMKDRSEANILNDCLVAMSAAGCLAWRNNTGQLPDKNGRPIKFGLCVGSSDIIGIAPDGVFLAIECKTRMGQPTDAQVRFINSVNNSGGRAGIARNSSDAVQIALAKVTGKS
jgi:hypothetical protein